MRRFFSRQGAKDSVPNSRATGDEAPGRNTIGAASTETEEDNFHALLSAVRMQEPRLVREALKRGRINVNLTNKWVC